MPPSDKSNEQPDLDAELKALLDHEQPLTEQTELLFDCVKELAARKAKLYSNRLSESEADEISSSLDELELQIIRYFSTVYDELSKNRLEQEVFIKKISQVMFDVENIRYSAFNRLYPNCAHCEAQRMNNKEYEEYIKSIFDDRENLEIDAESLKRDVLNFFQDRTESYVNVSSAHLPEEYRGFDKNKLTEKLVEYGVDVLKTTVAFVAAIAIYEAISKK